MLCRYSLTHSLTHVLARLINHSIILLLARAAVGYVFYLDVIQDYDRPSEKDDDDIGSQGTNWYIVYGNLMALIGSFSFAIFMVLLPLTHQLTQSLT